MELSRKTTILLTPRLHDALTQLARVRGVSMGELIRVAVEAHYGVASVDERLAAVGRLAAMGLPVGSPSELKAESTGYDGSVP